MFYPVELKDVLFLQRDNSSSYLMLILYVKEITYYYKLNDDDDRNAISELLMLSFVMPDFHAEPCPDAAAKYR